MTLKGKKWRKFPRVYTLFWCHYLIYAAQGYKKIYFVLITDIWDIKNTNKIHGLFIFKYFLDSVKLMKIGNFPIFSTIDCLPLPIPQGGVVVTMINKMAASMTKQCACDYKTAEMIHYTHASENCILPTR